MDAKRAMRRAAIKQRDALDDGHRSTASRQALLHLVGELRLSPTSVVAAFWPIGGELDTRPLLEALAALGVATCLPRMVAKGQPLTFRRFRPGDALVEGPMRVLEPAADAEALSPSIVVVPMLAFDGDGYRLGYGGGFYDRTLPRLAASQVVGVAFEAQRVEAIPRGPNDVRLATIVTETGVHHFP